MNDADRAKAAERLTREPVLLDALASIRNDALDALTRHDADDKTGLIRLQQKALLTNEIIDVLDEYIRAGEVVPIRPVA